MSVVIVEGSQWKRIGYRDIVIHFRGDEAAGWEISRQFRNQIVGSMEQAASVAAAVKGHFALMVEAPDYAFACVDHCRSIPVFYVESGHGRSLVLSNNARTAQRRAGLVEVDKASVLEASMAGFVTGQHTLYKYLLQLQAGEVLWHDRKENRTCVHNYYRYLPDFNGKYNGSHLIEGLGNVMQCAFERVVKEANGRKILVPLSAGLDSRVVICMLVESGYKNIEAFSYGPAGNDEAKAARSVAAKLGVPWTFYRDRSKEMCQLYESGICSSYGEFADGLGAAPNLQDLLAVQKVVAANGSAAEAFIVNGQTGDFISGGHIPRSLWQGKDLTIEHLFSEVVKKHYSLWGSLKTRENLQTIQGRFRQALALEGNIKASKQQLIELYELWEYQERQAKFIINGQRAYEYVGLDWALPFWDREVVDFWRGVPHEQKFNQKLYKQYLETWDFESLFSGWAPTVWHWPGAVKGVLPILRLTRLTLGRRARDWLLKRFLFIGMYRHQYAPFGFRTFFKHAGNLRNPISLISRKWLVDLGLSHGVSGFE